SDVPELDDIVLAPRGEQEPAGVPGQAQRIGSMALEDRDRVACLHVPEADRAVFARRGERASVWAECQVADESLVAIEAPDELPRPYVPEVDRSPPPRRGEMASIRAECQGVEKASLRCVDDVDRSPTLEVAERDLFRMSRVQRCGRRDGTQRHRTRP